MNAYCQACGEPCRILWRREANPSGAGSVWDFVSKCCEATVVDEDGCELTLEEADAQ